MKPRARAAAAKPRGNELNSDRCGFSVAPRCGAKPSFSTELAVSGHSMAGPAHDLLKLGTGDNGQQKGRLSNLWSFAQAPLLPIWAIR